MQRRDSYNHPRKINRQLPIRIFCFPLALTLSPCVWIIKVPPRVLVLRNSVPPNMRAHSWIRCFRSFKYRLQPHTEQPQPPPSTRALKPAYRTMGEGSRLIIHKARLPMKRVGRGETLMTVLGTLGMLKHLSFFSGGSTRYQDLRLSIKR